MMTGLKVASIEDKDILAKLEQEIDKRIEVIFNHAIKSNTGNILNFVDRCTKQCNNEIKNGDVSVGDYQAMRITDAKSSVFIDCYDKNIEQTLKSGGQVELDMQIHIDLDTMGDWVVEQYIIDDMLDNNETEITDETLLETYNQLIDSYWDWEFKYGLVGMDLFYDILYDLNLERAYVEVRDELENITGISLDVDCEGAYERCETADISFDYELAKDIKIEECQVFNSKEFSSNCQISFIINYTIILTGEEQ